MPAVMKGESRSDYMSRCVPMVIKEGKTNEQAVGKCEGMFSQHVKNELQTFTINIQGDLVEEKTLEGEEYWVAPMVMMTECVANGSQGPLYYSAEELEKWTPAWNHKPIVTPNHPESGSACTQEFLDKNKIGVVLNATWNGKQRAYGWFNKKRTQQLEPRVANALKSGRMMELSTGLYVDPAGSGGEFKGEKYTAMAINHRPDHLAILPDKIGACSIAKGAGLLQLNELCHEDLRVKLEDELQEQYTEEMKTYPNLYRPYVRSVYDTYFIYSFGGNLYQCDYKVDKSDDVTIVGDCTQVELKEEYVPVENADPLGNRQFTSEQRKKAADSGAAMSDGSFPIENVGDLKNAIRAIGRAKDPAAAKRHIITRAKALGHSDLLPDSWNVHNAEREETMTKAEKVEKIIKNTERTNYEESDRKYLEGLDEKRLDKLVTLAEAKKPVLSFNSQEDYDSAVAKTLKEQQDADAKKKLADEQAKNQNKDVPQLTPEQWLAAVPPAMKEIFNDMSGSYQGEKNRLITVITANKNNVFKPEDLNKMGMDLLRNMAAIAQPTEQQTNSVGAGNFIFGAPIPAQNNAPQTAVLSAPVYNKDQFARPK